MPGLIRLVGVVLVPLVAAAAAQQPAGPPQPAPPATGFILGRTIDGSTGKPVSGATVVLSTSSAAGPAEAVAQSATTAATSRFPARVLSDSTGTFVFRELPAGTYSLSGTKPGYSSAAYGRSSVSDIASQSVVVRDGERRGDMNLRFWKYGSISGRVLDEAGEPVIGLPMRVFRRTVTGGRSRFSSAGNQPITDDRGVYRTATLPPGSYVVGIVTSQATAPASLSGEYAAADAGGGSAEFRRELDRSASSLGGSPATMGGQRVGTWLLAQNTSELVGRSGLNARVEGRRVLIYPSTFYPNATAISSAAVIALESGEERTAVDFRIKPMPAFSVSGRLSGAGAQVGFTTITLMSTSLEDNVRLSDLSTATAVTDAEGAFTFLGVPPGEYTMRMLKIPPRPISTSSMTTIIQTGTTTISSSTGSSAAAPIGQEPTWWAEGPVSVRDRDVSGLVLSARTGARVTGRVQFEGAAEKPPANRLPTISVQLDPADGRLETFLQSQASRGAVEQSGQFRTHQVPPGRYVIRSAGAVPNWTFKGAYLNGRNIADEGFEIGGDDVDGVTIVFTDKTSELSGAARDARGPDATATVMVFPANQTIWGNSGPFPRQFRVARAGSDGSYRLPSLPPGDYLAIAVRGGYSSDWTEPEFLKKLAPLSTRVSIADGEKKVLDLETREVRR